MLLPILIFLHLSITLFLAANLNIWTDEAYSLQTSGKDVGYAIHQALYFELHPPLYFILLNLWRSFNSSLFFARLFSVLCTALAIYVVAGISQRFLKEIHPCWVAASVAFNPFVIWVAVEIRLYAFAILLSALLLLLFFDGYLTEVPQTKARWFYVLFSVLALYTQYYFGFLLVANALTLLVLRRWCALLGYFFGMIIVALCFTPIILIIHYIHYQSAVHIQTTTSVSSFFEGFAFMFQKAANYTLPVIESASLTSSLRKILIPFFFILVAVSIKKIYRFIAIRHTAILTTNLILFIVFFAFFNLFGPQFLEPQHTIIFFIPTILFVFAVVKGIPRKNALLIWTVVTMFFYSTSLYTTYKPMAKIGDWDRVASYIMAAEKPSQAILAFDQESAMNLAYYYSGSNAIVPIPKELDFQTYDVHDFVLKDEKQIFTALSRVSGDHQFIWLVNQTKCMYADVNFNCGILEKFVNKYYSVESTKNFFKSRVRLLHWKLSYYGSSAGSMPS